MTLAINPFTPLWAYRGFILGSVKREFQGKYRNSAHLGPVLWHFVQFWFWFTPIVYAPTVLPEQVQTLMAWNPMAPLMAAFQGALVQGLWPNWSSLWYPALMALGLCAIGVRLFLRHAGDMVDEL